MDAGQIGRNATEIYRTLLTNTTNDVLGVGFDTDGIKYMLQVLAEHDNPPSVRLLAAESMLKESVSDFTTASSAADLVAADVLSLRTATGWLNGPLVYTGEAVVSVISTDSRTAALSTHDEGFVEAARDQYGRMWEEAEPFRLRTPPFSRVRDTLNEQFGSDFRADFERMRVALDSERGDSEVDEVVVSLLAAAKNERLLYDISTWGESIGLASRATFSRKKATLEEHGLIDTEKVPIDVGRPRLRLLLGDERLQRTDSEELIGIAQSRLSTTTS